MSNFLTLQREKSCKAPDILFEYYFVLNFTIEIRLCSIIITHVLIIIKLAMFLWILFFLLHSYFHFCDKYIFWKKMLFLKKKNDVKFLLLCLLLLMLLVCFCFYLSCIYLQFVQFIQIHFKINDDCDVTFHIKMQIKIILNIFVYVRFYAFFCPQS